MLLFCLVITDLKHCDTVAKTKLNKNCLQATFRCNLFNGLLEYLHIHFRRLDTRDIFVVNLTKALISCSLQWKKTPLSIVL